MASCVNVDARRLETFHGLARLVPSANHTLEVDMARSWNDRLAMQILATGAFEHFCLFLFSLVRSLSLFISLCSPLHSLSLPSLYLLLALLSLLPLSAHSLPFASLVLFSLSLVLVLLSSRPPPSLSRSQFLFSPFCCLSALLLDRLAMHILATGAFKHLQGSGYTAGPSLVEFLQLPGPWTMQCMKRESIDKRESGKREQSEERE
jgi:hypothetical protein